jgi:hypothetical protein
MASGMTAPTLIAMNNGTAKQIRPEHLDASCKFFGVEAKAFLEAEDVKLPLRQNIRPDRRKKG